MYLEASRYIWNTAVNKLQKVYCRSWYTPVLSANFIPLPIIVDKVLLEHSHSYLFTGCLWLLLCYKERLSSCKADYGACRAKKLLSVSYGKGLLALDFVASIGMLVSFLRPCFPICKILLYIKEILSCRCFPITLITI